MRIGELKHKDLPMYRKQGKIEALKAAREKASYLVEAMGQQLGEVIRIIEPADNNISRYLPILRKLLRKSFSIIANGTFV